MLMIHPLVLGSEAALPGGGAFASFGLPDGVTATTIGVTIATYQPVR
jgi:hypothetical protein